MESKLVNLLYLKVFFSKFHVTVTYPLDITKTRLQVQGEHASHKSIKEPAPYRGMIKTAAGIGIIPYYLLKFIFPALIIQS